jgi:serine/threonine protein kinase
MIGKLINDRYKVKAEIGQGGMGTVYRAHDSVLDRDVALKLLTSVKVVFGCCSLVKSGV